MTGTKYMAVLVDNEENHKGEFCPYTKESKPCQELVYKVRDL